MKAYFLLLMTLLLTSAGHALAQDEDLDELFGAPDAPASTEPSGQSEPNEGAAGRDAPAAEPYEGSVPLTRSPQSSPDEGQRAEEPRARSRLIEEIVVTAQKREEAIQDVPISISAYSGDTLKLLGVTDTADLSALVPGFTYANSGFGSPVYTLRGIGFTDASYTASSTVGIYVDEANLPFSVLTKAANVDIQRVEVLKGPQGTLYGRNTTGGAVNYIANKPTQSLEAGVDVSYGRFETTEVEGYVSGPFTDALAARLAVFDVRSQEGWQRSLTRYPDGEYNELGRQDRQAARFTLDWDATSTLFNRFSLSYSRDRGEPQAPQAIALQPQSLVPGTTAPEVRNHPLVPRDSDDPRVADWAVRRQPNRENPEELRWRNNETFVFGSWRSDWSLSEDMTLTVLGSAMDFSIDDAYLPQNGLSVVNVERKLNADITAWSLEARVSGAWGDAANSWVAGAFTSGDKVDQIDVLFIDTVSSIVPDQTGTGQDPLLLGDTITVLGFQKADTVAVFANSDWAWSEQWGATVGLRYTRENRSYRGCTADGPDAESVIGFPAVFTAISISRGGTGGVDPNECFTLNPPSNNNGVIIEPPPLEEDNVSGRLALNWKPTVDSLYYLSYSRGFKSGSFPVVSASDGRQLTGVTQEQLDAFELGGKTSWFSETVKLNFAGFFYKYKDKQLLTRFQDPAFGPLPILDNAPKSEVRGFEMDLQASPFSRLYVTGALAYIETEVIEFDSVDESGNERSFAGNSFNFTPRLTYTVLANYDQPVWGGWLLNLGADYTYTDETNSVLGADPLYDHDDYFNLNLRVGTSSPNGAWGITAWGRNVTNELQTLSVYDPGDMVVRLVGMPKTYGLTLRYRFGDD